MQGFSFASISGFADALVQGGALGEGKSPKPGQVELQVGGGDAQVHAEGRDLG